MRRYFSAALQTVCDIATWVCVILAVLWIAVFFVPKMFGYHPFVVLSGSMEPLIHVGSLAYVQPFDENEEPEYNEVLAYKAKDGKLVLHRLIGMSDTGYVFKGDANDGYDMNMVSGDEILGRYAFSMPLMGYAAAWVLNHEAEIGPVKIPAVVLFMAGTILVLNVICGIVNEIFGKNREEQIYE